MSQRELYNRGGLTRWYWDYRDRAILKHTAPAWSILDVGCGEGITLEKIFRQGPWRRILGIDPDVRNVAACMGEGLPVLMGDVYHLSERVIDDWDCVLMADVIEHLTDPLEALKECRSVVSDRGRVVVMFPDDNLFKIVRLMCGKFKEAFVDNGHLRKWYPRQTKVIFQEAGLRVEKVERIPLHWIVVGRK